ncbi:MAG: DNA recombination protein RmuC [Lentisphaerae bacterium]|nr:DNA recombination protein RmuC [Lentisphaerota bacterium]
MEYVLASLVVAIPVMLGALYVVYSLRHRGQADNGLALSLLQNQIASNSRQMTQQVEEFRKTLADSIRTLSDRVSGSMTDNSKAIGTGLDTTSKLVGDVRQQLGQLERSSRQMLDVGKEILKLEDILRPPKLRGGLGELFLADLLAQILPSSHYHLQYQFKGGETVDAVVALRSGLVSIDAKFPLENFRRILTSESDEQRKSARRAFLKDIKNHIDNIASKYIRTDENTFDFALMYIPAENVYYETIIKDDEFDGEMALFNYALNKRVIPVSPNSFYAYLQTIILGLKGMRVEEKSRDILDNLSRLHKEFETFSESFRLVGQHLDNCVKKFAEAQKRFGKMEAKVEQIDGLTRGLEAGTELQRDKHPLSPPDSGNT